MFLSFLLRRLGQTLATLVLVTVLVFTLARLTGDPALVLSASETTNADLDFFRRQYGLDRPWPAQYATFLSHIVVGDFGTSFRQREPALGIVLEAMGPTLELAAAGMALSIVIGLPIGVLAAVTRRRWVRRLVQWYGGLGQALPPFWVGLTLVTLFALTLPILPSSGYGHLSNFVLPALTLATFSSAAIARLTQTNMEEALKSDFIHLERVLGLSERRVVLKHALRNAALPILTYIGLQFGLLLGGSIVTERVFAWPGIGQTVIEAILNRDYPVIQASVFVTALLLMLVNLAVDICCGVLDPRVRI